LSKTDWRKRQLTNTVIELKVHSTDSTLVPPSGWMMEDHFVRYLKHFIANVKPSKERPVFLLLDNDDSHLSIEALDYYTQNGATVVSFLPHCSHKIQPLKVSVCRPFKTYANCACDA
jgi:hypothetical protein